MEEQWAATVQWVAGLLASLVAAVVGGSKVHEWAKLYYARHDAERAERLEDEDRLRRRITTLEAELGSVTRERDQLRSALLELNTERAKSEVDIYRLEALVDRLKQEREQLSLAQESSESTLAEVDSWVREHPEWSEK